jgi:hypothetical protein
MVRFVFKVMLLSALVSIALKFGGRYLPITGTTTTVLIAVWLPSIFLAVLLLYRWQRDRPLGS